MKCNKPLQIKIRIISNSFFLCVVLIFAAILALSAATLTEPELNHGHHVSSTPSPTTPQSSPNDAPFVCEHYRMGLSWPSDTDRNVYLKCDALSGAPTEMRCPAGTIFEFQRQRCVFPK